MKRLAMCKAEIAGLLVAMTLVPSALAQTNTNQGQHDTIKVHGHWTIVVRNADGGVASRHEFENSLTTGAADAGAGVISSLLSRNAVAGPWMVALDGNQYICNGANHAPNLCWIVEPSTLSFGEATAGYNLFTNLTMQRPTSGANAYAIVLSGTAKAANTGNITLVHTTLATCPVNETPVTCIASKTDFNVIGSFSAYTLTTPINVQAGQSVDVTVVISFS